MTPEQIDVRRAAALEAVALRRVARAAEARAAPELLAQSTPPAFGEEAARRLLAEPRFRKRLGARLARLTGVGAPPWTASPGALAVLEMDAPQIETLRLDSGAALEAPAVLGLLKGEEQKRLSAALGRDPAAPARRYGAAESEDGADVAWPDPEDQPERLTPEEIAEAVRLAGAQAFAAWLAAQPVSVAARVGLLAPAVALAEAAEDPDLARRGAELVERIAAGAAA